ncbi:MAG: hypothetical protein WBA51_11880, partial [Erythrobacter sp.]
MTLLRSFMPVGACIALTMLGTSPLTAQDKRASQPEIGNSPIIGKLENCTSIADNTERLACFDREVGALVGASGKGEVKVVQTDDITDARRRLFGFSLPNIGLFGDSDEEEVKDLRSTVTKVRKVSNNEWHFWIEEGNAKWRVKSTSIRFRAPEVGD